jgi:hypothetical protein
MTVGLVVTVAVLLWVILTVVLIIYGIKEEEIGFYIFLSIILIFVIILISIIPLSIIDNQKMLFKKIKIQNIHKSFLYSYDYQYDFYINNKLLKGEMLIDDSIKKFDFKIIDKKENVTILKKCTFKKWYNRPRYKVAVWNEKKIGIMFDREKYLDLYKIKIEYFDLSKTKMFNKNYISNKKEKPIIVKKTVDKKGVKNNQNKGGYMNIFIMFVIALIVVKLGHYLTLKFFMKPIKRFIQNLVKTWKDID